MPRSLFLQNQAALAGRMYMAPAGDHGSEDGAGGTGAGESGEGSEEGDEQGDADADADAGSDEDADGDEGNKLSDSEARLLKDMMKSKNRAKAAEEEAGSLKQQLEALTESLGGKSPEDIAALLSAEQESERKKLEEKGEYNRIVDQMAEENKSIVDDLNVTIDQQKTEIVSLHAQIEELTVGRAFSDSQFVSDDLTLPMSITRKEFGTHFELVDGQVVGFDKPRGSSDRTPLVDNQGANLSFDQAIARLVKGHPEATRLLRSKAKPGAKSTSQEKPGMKSDQSAVSGQSRIERALNGKK